MFRVVNSRGGELGVEESRAKSLGVLEGVRRRREMERVIGGVGEVGEEGVEEGGGKMGA